MATLSIFDFTLALLQAYFLLMNFTVEHSYCAAPLDSGFLHRETIDFCSQHNKLFLDRPKWMVTATCASAYGLSSLYIFLLINILTGWWFVRKSPFGQLLIASLIGAKVYAILFYHYMEFTSSTPPENLLPYFSVEG